jgi:hypothetical protein
MALSASCSFVCTDGHVDTVGPFVVHVAGGTGLWLFLVGGGENACSVLTHSCGLQCHNRCVVGSISLGCC